MDMEAINEWRETSTKSTERLEYLEQGLMELEGKIRKRLSYCQNTDGNEGASRKGLHVIGYARPGESD